MPLGRKVTDLAIIPTKSNLAVTAILFHGVVPTLMLVSDAFIGMSWSFGTLNSLGETDNPLTDVILRVLLAMVGIAESMYLATHMRAVCGAA